MSTMNQCAHRPHALAMAALLACLSINALAQAQDEVGKQEKAEDAQIAAELPGIVIKATKESLGTKRIDRKEIQGTPGGNGDITSLLVTVPNVQFANDQLGANALGEIDPANVSINGAKFYENLFTIDGMSMNSDINPANASESAIDMPGKGRSQGFDIDTSLLCGITVRDSNIGAAYGRFTGGVISAETCAPTQTFAGEVSVEHTRSSWVRYHFEPGQAEEFSESADADVQPEFSKWTYRAALQGKVSDRLSLIGSVVRKTSTIPLRAYSDGRVSATDVNDKKQQRQHDNLFLKAFWTPVTGVDVDAALTYAPESSDMFIANMKDSHYTLKGGGLGLNVGVSHQVNDMLRLNHRITATETESSRDSDRDETFAWSKQPSKDWGVTTQSTEGGYGDIDQKERRLGYELKGDVSPVQWGSWQHTLSGGLAYEATDYFYARLTPYTAYSGAKLDPSVTCELAAGGFDTTACVPGEQYLATRLMYRTGQFNVKNENYAFFLQDELQRDRVRLRLGLRYEHDTGVKDDSLSPRLAAFWDVFGTGRTQLELGANRYYGRNFQTYAIKAKRSEMQGTNKTRPYTGGLLGAWPDPAYGAPGAVTHYDATDDLKVPHTDEKVFGLSQTALGATWAVKYVQRASRNEVVRYFQNNGTTSEVTWTNKGRTDADVWTLTVMAQEPLKWAGSSTKLSAAFDLTDVKTSHASYSYDDRLSNLAASYDDQDIISYDGKFIRYIDRPANNFNRPWSARLMASTSVPKWGLTVDQVFRLRDGYTKITATTKTVPYQGQQVKVWERTKFSKSMVWDMRVNYEIPTVSGQSAYVNLTVENLLDRKNMIESSGDNGTYEKGRQIWVKLGYKF